MARRNVRVKISRKPAPLISLMKALKVKHTADGVNSPLDAAEVTAMDVVLGVSDDKNSLSEQLHKDAETATHERDVALGTAKGQNSTTPDTLINYARKFRNVLLGKYLGDENKLGDWGFTVDTSPVIKKKDGNTPA